MRIKIKSKQGEFLYKKGEGYLFVKEYYGVPINELKKGAIILQQDADGGVFHQDAHDPLALDMVFYGNEDYKEAKESLIADGCEEGIVFARFTDEHGYKISVNCYAGDMFIMNDEGKTIDKY